MNKKKLLTLAVIVFTSLFCLVILSFNAFKVKAELIVPEDYEYVDTWDDSYLLTNLEGERTIEAEGVPTGNRKR